MHAVTSRKNFITVDVVDVVDVVERESELWRKIPVDVFINHVMPYVYKKQDVALLDDIRNFYLTLNS